MTEAIKRYDFKEGMPFEFEIVSISALFKQSRHELTAPHRTAFYHIIWFQSGTPTHIVDFNPVPIQPNTLLFLNKDTVQLFDSQGGFEAQAILFTDHFFCRSEADIRYLRSTILFNDLLGISYLQLDEASPVLSTLFSLMERELLTSNEVHQPDILRNYLHNFLLLAERERRRQNFIEIKKGADLEYTVLFKEQVEARYKQVKQVSSYAASLSLSEKRLNQATSKVLGKTPKTIIDERVMLEAKRLLSHTHESIKEIGYELGFQEPTNFIKYFRKHNGNTPVEFREQFTA